MNHFNKLQKDKLHKVVAKSFDFDLDNPYHKEIVKELSNKYLEMYDLRLSLDKDLEKSLSRDIEEYAKELKITSTIKDLKSRGKLLSNIDKLLIERGISVNTLQSAIKVTRFRSKILNGHDFGISKLQEICIILGCTMTELFEEV